MATRINIQAHPSQVALPNVDSNVLLELFPFAIILDQDMRIRKCGEKLLETWIVQNPNQSTSSFYNAIVTKHFKLRRPKGIQFNWKTVVQMHTVLFELELIRDPEKTATVTEISNEDMVNEQLQALQLDDLDALESGATGPDGTSVAIEGLHSNYRLLLKGQMRYIADLDAIVFLCSPL